MTASRTKPPVRALAGARREREPRALPGRLAYNNHRARAGVGVVVPIDAVGVFALLRLPRPRHLRASAAARLVLALLKAERFALSQAGRQRQSLHGSLCAAVPIERNRRPAVARAHNMLPDGRSKLSLKALHDPIEIISRLDRLRRHRIARHPSKRGRHQPHRRSTKHPSSDAWHIFTIRRALSLERCGFHSPDRGSA